MPTPLQEYRTKREIAIEEIDRVIAAGARFGCVLANAGYGLSAPLRQALSTRGFCWAVRTASVGLSGYRATDLPRSGARSTAGASHTGCRIYGGARDARRREVRQVSWRKGAKGWLRARLAATLADDLHVKRSGTSQSLPIRRETIP